MSPEIVKWGVNAFLRWLVPMLYGMFGWNIAEEKVGEIGSWLVAGVLLLISLITSIKGRKNIKEGAGDSGGGGAVAPMLLLALVAGLGMTGCTGQKVRENVLVPALQSAGVGVEVDARRGLDSMTSDERQVHQEKVYTFFGELAQGDVPQIVRARALYWPSVKHAATIGINVQEPELGPNSTQQLRKRLIQFEEKLAKLAGPTPVPGGSSP